VFHVELRQFPNVARSFNLSRADLDAQILVPWVAERPVELDDRRWSPAKARLTVYEGPELRSEDMGLGRSWGNVTRNCEEVTQRVLEEAAAIVLPDSAASVEQFKLELAGHAADRAVPIHEVPALAGRRHPGARASEQLALAERSVWELLHQRRVQMVRGGVEVGEEEWQRVLLDWQTWTADVLPGIALEAIAGS
jgi:hypothetical protein